MDIYSVIQSLVNQAIKAQLIEIEDERYSKNQLMDIVGLNEFPLDVQSNESLTIPDLLEKLSDYAVEKKLIGVGDANKEFFESKVMNVFILRPSEINRVFYRQYEQDPSAATSYFYKLSKNSNYIQLKSITRNISYLTETPYGYFNITINLSKPEKDPVQIAQEREFRQKDINYPKCLLCIENEGYTGRIGYPARSNHRMIRMELAGETWFFQYSPYVYYNEHCVLISKEHRDMKINDRTFRRLLEFVEKFPHYFIGSNSDLPIVGGSILSHDHYQGGSYDFAMAKATDELTFRMEDYSDIEATTIKWPMSVIRLRGRKREQLVRAADEIYRKWQNYSDAEANIYAFTGEVRHNTVTPIARCKNGRFELDLVLRNNKTSKEHPMGIFHPHDDVHHIKKENIGLIEVMGLAVLPARLKEELNEIETYLLGQTDKVKEYHQSWAKEIKEHYRSQLSVETIKEILRKELGLKFLKALTDAGVFKRTETGHQAFLRFIKGL